MLNKPIFISFSGGRSSALTARILVEHYGKENCIILFANTGKEQEETYDFVKECAENWNYNIIWIEATFEKYNGSKSQRDCIGFKVVDSTNFRRNNRNVKMGSVPYGNMIDAYEMIPNRMARFCTEYLKVIPMQKYLSSIGLGVNDYYTAMGIRFDEPLRVKKHPDKLLPLHDHQITKQNVLDWWKKQSFDLQLQEHEGNCDLCPLKSERKIKTLIAENQGIENWWKEYESKYESSFNSKTLDELKHLSQLRFSRYHENTQQNELFGSDVEISCFCGD
jgi:3'-phosphoadenosine 5'-phosphosulfate sulfotransferase (PAPS reductase)/FAD synthetase